jgi:hypothetical protein
VFAHHIGQRCAFAVDCNNFWPTLRNIQSENDAQDLERREKAPMVELVDERETLRLEGPGMVRLSFLSWGLPSKVNSFLPILVPVAPIIRYSRPTHIRR